jgi:two-component system sensor histidine kinase UhpB
MRAMALSIAQRVGAVDGESERAARLIAEESSRLYDAMHGIIPRLTPLVLDNFGLAEALNDLAERTQRIHADVQIDVNVELADGMPCADVSLALYRAAQEGITNALRHGKARHLQLSLQEVAGDVTLELVDDGTGMPPEDPQRGGHYGLRWLAERVEGLGGTLGIERAVPHGVRLKVRLPLSTHKETA